MKQIKRCVSILLACMCLLTSSALAATNASDQIVSYSIYATPIGNGQITIDFTIMAPFNVEEIGAGEIYVFERSGTALIPAAHYTKDDPGMIRTDTFCQANSIIFDGVAGKTYYITVSVFATDYNGGSDSRSRSFTVTAT